MADNMIFEGKTTEEAINNGLKTLNVTRDKITYKVIEEPTKRLFSILTPRVVKVELTVIEKTSEIKKEVKKEIAKEEKKEVREYVVKEETLEKAKLKSEEIVGKLCEKLKISLVPIIKIENKTIMISLEGKELGYLIGYRGDTLDSVQTIISAMVNKDLDEHVRILLDIENYRQKRVKVLEGLAERIARDVVREKRNISLEPMSPMERKIIHSKLQDNNYVKTISIGEEPYRKVVISLK